MIKQTRTIPYTPLGIYIEDKNLSYADVARAIGVSGACVTAWRDRGTMPFYMGIVMKQFNKAPKPVVLLMTGNPADVAEVTPILERFNIKVTSLEIPTA